MSVKLLLTLCLPLSLYSPYTSSSIYLIPNHTYTLQL
ncbi:hypothetical protein [Klebsiella phage pKP-BM327-1.2]|nr:hypothetical protein [Klebsiella phage pKP-BM327-1.2]